MQEGPELQERLNACASELVEELNAFLGEVRAPIKVEHFSSVLRITFTEHQEYADLLFFELRNRGIQTYEGRPILLTRAHTHEDLAAVREAFFASVNRLIEVGLLDGRDPDLVRQIPMTIGQQEIWVSSQFGPEASCSYNLCSTLDLTGAFDLEVFRTVLKDIAERHEALRTVPDRDGATQSIRPHMEIPLTVEDGRTDDEAALAARIERAKHVQVATPFDLIDGPLVRCHIVRQADDRWLVLFTVHHVIADGWSCSVLMRDLGDLYAARKTGQAPALQPAQQLSDFVAFASEPDQIAARAKARDYWLKLYSGEFPRVDFPSDRGRPKLRDYSAERLAIPVDPAVTNALRKVARDNGTTLLAALIGGFAAYLSRLTGATESPIGFSAAGQPLLGGKDLVGHCVNFLPLRLATNLDEGFNAHLRGIGASVIDGLEHQTFDFVSLVQEIQPTFEPNWAPLVTMSVNLDASTHSSKFADLSVEVGSVGRVYEHLDLFLNFVEVDAELELQCTFNTTLFDRTTVQRRMEEYLQLLAAASDQPETALSAVEIVRPGDRPLLLSDWNGVEVEYPRDASLADLFRSVARTHPDRTALLVSDGAAEIPQRQITYDELDRLSDAWAARLRAASVKRGDFVGVVLPRSLNLIVALVAVLKAGAAYVPIAATTPPAAVRRVLDHSQASALLTWSALDPAAIPDGIMVVAMDVDQGEAPAIDLSDTATSGGDPAYVIYTSGSTGTPKGVIVPQRGISRLVLATDYTPLDSSRTFLLLAPISFDISMFEIWGALLNGARLVVPPWDLLPDLRRLGDIVKATGVSPLQMTPALFNAIIDETPDILSDVEELMIGGEALSVYHTHRALKLLPKTTLINVYGPTENAVWSTFNRVPRDFDARSTSVSIGRSINNSTAYIVDARMRLVPPGVTGELVVGGDGVALGYLRQPELSDQVFVPDTISGTPGARLYRTGDYCRYLPDGTIEFLGRRDNQVKIRGFRIELGEVEASLQDIAGVRQAVAVHEPGADGGRLVAFVLPDEMSITGEGLIQRLRERLPRHLVPAQITLVEDLPLSAHGKVDRKALLRLQTAQEEVVHKVAPRTALERELSTIWAELLQRPVDSIEDSFFSLGGQSLMAVRLFDRIRRRFGVDLAISTLFSHPTIRDLAILIEESSKSGATSVAASADWDTTTVIHPGPDRGSRPLFIVGGVGGNVNNLFDFGDVLGRHRTVIGIQTRGVLGHTPRASIEEMAAENIRYIRLRQPQGPYLLAGYSGGAWTAFEMARQLRASGQTVAELIILDITAPNLANRSNPASAPVKISIARRLKDELQLLKEYGTKHLRKRASAKFLNFVLRGKVIDLVAMVNPTFARSRRSARAWFGAARKYNGGSYDGSVKLVVTKPIGVRAEQFLAEEPYLGWDELVPRDKIACIQMDGGHLDMVRGENAEILAELIEGRIGASTAI